MTKAQNPTRTRKNRPEPDRPGRKRRLALGILAAGVLMIADRVEPLCAEDELPTGGSFPAPQAKPAGEVPAPDGDWSRPSIATRTPQDESLPPPQIIRSSRRVPNASTGEGIRAVRDVPVVARAPWTTPPSAPYPRAGAAAAPLPAPTAPPPAPTAPPPAPYESHVSPAPLGARSLSSANQGAAQPVCRILSIQKTHNVESDGSEQGLLFLQLDVEYEVYGQTGRDVFIGAWFVRSADGRFVPSATQRYADAAGNVTIQTRWTRVAGPYARYAATLLVPYGTFPADQSGAESYEVEARVQLLRNEARGRVSMLARDLTTFRVYGPPKEGRRPARARGRQLDTRGFATPGESGEIDAPGEPDGFGAEDTPGESGVILTPGVQDGGGSKATPGESGTIDAR